MSDHLSYDWLRSTGAEPKWFGLGFIQLKLDETHRMHFWHPSLQPDVPVEEIHDHRYEFTSKVLKGSLIHETFTIEPYAFGFYEMTEVSCDPDTPAPDGRKVRVSVVNPTKDELTAGAFYRLPLGAFHRVQAKSAVTLVKRLTPPTIPFARVVRPLDRIHQPHGEVCPFSNPRQPEFLWDLIRDLLDEGELPQPTMPGYHLREIAKGELGEASKIMEEAEEFMDAIEQDVALMGLVELSDLVGAVEAFLAKHHPTISLDDLRAMSDVTKRAFLNGRR